MQDITVVVKRAEFEQACQCQAREYVTCAVDAAVQRATDAGRAPRESAIREAEVNALTQLVAGVMAANAELRSRLDRIEESGFTNWLRRWLRRK